MVVVGGGGGSGGGWWLVVAKGKQKGQCIFFKQTTTRQPQRQPQNDNDNSTIINNNNHNSIIIRTPPPQPQEKQQFTQTINDAPSPKLLNYERQSCGTGARRQCRKWVANWRWVACMNWPGHSELCKNLGDWIRWWTSLPLCGGPAIDQKDDGRLKHRPQPCSRDRRRLKPSDGNLQPCLSSRLSNEQKTLVCIFCKQNTE